MPSIITSFEGSPTGDLSFSPNFSLRKLGDRVAIVGPNGAGKSRFLEFLANELWSNRPESTISFNDPSITKPTVAFIPDDLVLWNDADNTQDSLFAEHFNRILPTVFAVLKEAAQDYSLSFIPEEVMSEEEKNLAQSRWLTLRDNVSDIVAKKLTISRSGNLQLSGVDISEDTLSKGQSRLLQLAVALSAVSDERPMILIWDEPELHLHPKVVRKVLDVISSKFNCQIWIATHSLTLVSYIGIDDVWYLSSDGLMRGKDKKEELVGELFGGGEQVDQLEAFLSPSHELASVMFARDSLCTPAVVGYRDGDPQGRQVFEHLRDFSTTLGRPVRLIDWGAGKGRLVEAAKYELQASQKLAEILEYTAFDNSDKDKIECIETIGTVWEEGESRWINEFAEIKRRFAHEKADIVTLINVLHEISPAEWIKVINDIGQVISDDGNLLVVEDLAIPRGEMPNKYGFLLLGEASLRDLFNDNHGALTFKYKWNKRLLMATVPGRQVTASVEGLRACLKRCAEMALSEIEDIRASGLTDFPSGIKHMRSAMQCVNATLALQHIQ
jgi:ABC-type multidrug transport system ATPase subunit